MSSEDNEYVTPHSSNSLYCFVSLLPLSCSVPGPLLCCPHQSSQHLLGSSSLFFFCVHSYFFHLLLLLRPISPDIDKICLYNAVDISCLFCSSLPFFCTIIPYLWETCPQLYVSVGAVDHSTPVPPYLNPIYLATCTCMKILSGGAKVI